MKRSALQRLFANVRRRRRQMRATVQLELLETRVLLSCVDGVDHDDHDHPVNEFGDEEHWIPKYEADTTEAAIAGEAPPFPTSNTFNLSSLPGASHTIYLDFTGHTTSGTSWNSAYNSGNPFTTPAYDTDNNVGSFSEAEHEVIQRTWQRVAEDFAPFNVNVTTVEPPVSDLIKSGSGDTRWGIRVVIGPNTFYPNNAGGVAYLTSFNYGTDTPTYVFNSSLIGVAEAASHEVGHTLGLSHDGTSALNYYEGHGSGPTGWAPIMGVGYDRSLVQWSKGEYTGANQQQDDLSIITSNNGFGYRADDHGNSTGAATGILGGTASGIIERNTDVDYFQVTVGANDNIIINPFTDSPNLDILAKLYNSSGVQIDSSNPIGALNASFVGLAAGTYYVSIEGTGEGNLSTGYSDYGSLGQYTIDIGDLPIGDLDDQISEAPMVGNGTIYAELEYSPDYDDVDLYGFTVEAGATATFDVNAFVAYGLDSRLRLFDDNGNQLFANDDEDIDEDIYDPYISYTFNTAGTYYIGVSYWQNSVYNPVTGDGDFSGGQTGSYELVISGVNDVASGGIGSDVIARIGSNWWVARSNGSNGFTNVPYGAWDPNAGWNNVQTGDFNNDGLTDVVGRSVSGQLWVGINTGSSFNTQLWGYLDLALNIQELLVADVDGDGDSDIVGRSATGHWWVARSNGLDGFANQLWGGWVESAGWNNVMVADLNGDGNDDIIGRANNGQWWAAQSNGSAFSTTYWGYWVPSLGWQDIQVADVDGDGDSDLVGRSNTGSWWVARSNGSTGFTNEFWGGWVESAGWNNVMVIDLDGDGNDDIIGQANNGQWWAARSNGAGNFATEYWGYWVPSGWQDVQVIDVDQDGNIDVVGRDSGNSLWIARSNGSSGFTNELWGGFSGNGWTNVMVGNAGGGSPGATAIIDFDDDDDDTTIFG